MNVFKVGAIILLSIVFGFVSNYLNPNGIPFVEHEKKRAPITDAPPEHPVSVSKDELKKMLGEDNVVVLDARLSKAYEKAHIPGAVNIPFERLENVFDKIESFPSDKWLVTYCDNSACDLSELLARELYNLGYSYVGFYKGGIEDWTKTERVVHE